MDVKILLSFIGRTFPSFWAPYAYSAILIESDSLRYMDNILFVINIAP